MKVYKFGGASVKDADGVRNVSKILGDYKSDPKLVVVSAMGKMTNAFEELWIAITKKKSDFDTAFQKIKDFHQEVLTELKMETDSFLTSEIDRIYIGIKRIAEVPTVGANLDYTYDQVVSCGELLSTLIVSRYLELNTLPNRWMDARTIVKTDYSYREAKVDWVRTQKNVQSQVVPYFESGKLVITQGFLGGADSLNSTTLGREGSDYSAAIFAHCLEAEEVVIWKDVSGVLNADPKYFPEAVKLDSISYKEAIELAYYGASVIHPKTIQPLQNKTIPLRVKSFIEPDSKGTIIQLAAEGDGEIPSYIFKKDQKLISIGTKDFAFIIEENLREIFDVLTNHRVKVNIMQNSAINFSIAVDNGDERSVGLINELSSKYTVKYNDGLTLVTIRHYNEEVIDRLTGQNEILLEQKTRHTYRALIK